MNTSSRSTPKYTQYTILPEDFQKNKPKEYIQDEETSLENSLIRSDDNLDLKASFDRIREECSKRESIAIIFTETKSIKELNYLNNLPLNTLILFFYNEKDKDENDDRDVVSSEIDFSKLIKNNIVSIEGNLELYFKTIIKILEKKSQNQKIYFYHDGDMNLIDEGIYKTLLRNVISGKINYFINGAEKGMTLISKFFAKILLKNKYKNFFTLYEKLNDEVLLDDINSEYERRGLGILIKNVTLSKENFIKFNSMDDMIDHPSENDVIKFLKDSEEDMRSSIKLADKASSKLLFMMDNWVLILMILLTIVSFILFIISLTTYIKMLEDDKYSPNVAIPKSKISFLFYTLICFLMVAASSFGLYKSIFEKNLTDYTLLE